MGREERKREILELIDTALDNLIQEDDIESLAKVQGRSAPANFEKAWIPGTDLKSSGTKKEVEMNISTDEPVEGKWLFHNHPTGELPIPSFTDVVNAVKAKALMGITGSAITTRSGDRSISWTYIEPTDELLRRIGPIDNDDNAERKIESKLAHLRNLEGMPEEVFKELEKAGFNIKSSLQESP